jgi:hypothetical protein
MSALLAPSRLALRWEGAAITLLGWLALVAIPLSLGRIGISWDALNHHIYLGWTAERARFGQDLLAASYQSFQYPYLYWPAYKLASLGASGAVAGAVLASLHAVAVPAVWLVAKVCIPGRAWLDLALRAVAVVLGFASILVLSMFDSTANDLLAAVPLIWSVALSLLLVERKRFSRRGTAAITVAAGLLAGVSVACKLSNGPMAVLIPLIWICANGNWRERLQVVALGCASVLFGFVLSYGSWGWQLWVHVGNPVYPFGDEYFEPLRQRLGWHP